MTEREIEFQMASLQSGLLDVIRSHQTAFNGLDEKGLVVTNQRVVLHVLASLAGHYVVLGDENEARRMNHAAFFDNQVLAAIHMREKKFRKA